jgi:tryptophanyl-tRNA synthetase
MYTKKPFTPLGDGTDENGATLIMEWEKFEEVSGATPISAELGERFARVTGHQPHRFMRRNLVHCHRQLDMILDRYETGLPFYLFTGRGPSSDSMHIGHSIPFEFTKLVSSSHTFAVGL